MLEPRRLRQRRNYVFMPGHATRATSSDKANAERRSDWPVSVSNDQTGRQRAGRFLFTSYVGNGI